MKKKLENFIFYYKYYVIAAILIILIIAVLLKDNQKQAILEFVIVDDTSQMDIDTGRKMMEEFERQKGIKSGSCAFRYKTMYPNQKDYEDIAFDIAGINDYQECFKDGSIDMVITTADTLTREASYETVSLKQILSEDEISKYEKYIYYVNGSPAGIIFDKCSAAEKHFGDNYPTDYHYIIQVAAGSAEDECVKEFLQYLTGE